jgi:hypothetical protein
MFWPICCWVATFHNRTVLSPVPPVARVWPSGLKATDESPASVLVVARRCPI